MARKRLVQRLAKVQPCGAIAPGTHDENIDATVAEVRCMLPIGHQGVHAAIVEWRGRLEGWPDGGSSGGKLLGRESM